MYYLIAGFIGFLLGIVAINVISSWEEHQAFKDYWGPP